MSLRALLPSAVSIALLRAIGCKSDKTMTEEEAKTMATEMAKQMVEAEKQKEMQELQKQREEAERVKKEEQERKRRESQFINSLVKAGSKEFDRKMADLRLELDQALKDGKVDVAERTKAEIESMKKAFEKYKNEGFK